MSSVAGPETNERQLFELAQAKLDEAFTLLRALEEQLRTNEKRRIAASGTAAGSHAQQREDERARLLAYVENVHAEALQLAARTRPASAAQRRDLVRRITQRFDEVVAQIDVRDSEDAPWEAADEPVMPTTLGDIDRGRAPLRAVIVNPSARPEPSRARAETELAPASSKQRVLAVIEAAKTDSSVGSKAKSERARAATDIAPPVDPAGFVPLPWDEDTGAGFEPNGNASAGFDAHEAAGFAPIEGFVPTLVTDNPLHEREKSGARLRRDRSPTHVAPPAPRKTAFTDRPIVRHSAIVVVVAIVVGALIGVTVRAARSDVVGRKTAIRDTPVAEPMGPPSELAVPPSHVQPKPAVQANPARRAPRCATAKCRAARQPTRTEHLAHR